MWVYHDFFCYPDPDPSFLKWTWILTRIRANDTDPTGSGSGSGSGSDRIWIWIRIQNTVVEGGKRSELDGYPQTERQTDRASYKKFRLIPWPGKQIVILRSQWCLSEPLQLHNGYAWCKSLHVWKKTEESSRLYQVNVLTFTQDLIFILLDLYI